MARGSSKGPDSSTANGAVMHEAVVMLRPVSGKLAPDPDSTRRIAKAVLADATAKTGMSPETTNIMDQLHAFSLRAPQSFLDALSLAKQVAQVTANEDAGSAFIEPVRKRSVQLPE